MHDAGNGGSGRLDSWKEIAGHFGRSVRTVVRWEQEEGLPVHRLNHEKRGSVYAYRHELNRWFEERQSRPAARGRWRRWALLSAGLALPLAGLGWWWANERQAAIGSVAVAPFHDGKGESSESDRLASQLAEDLARGLARELAGAARVVRYREMSGEVKEESVLLVRVIENAGRLTVSAELARTQDNRILWSERSEQAAGNLLEIREELSRRIAAKIRRSNNGRSAGPGAQPGTGNSEAYREYLRGRHAWNRRTSEGMGEAIRHYQRAIDMDPAYAEAYAGLGEAYALQSYYAPVAPADAAPKARAAALKAISIDNGVAEAYGTLGYVEMDYYWDWESAERNFRRALEIDPGWADGHHWYGEYLVAMGRYREALAEYQIALELDPLSPIITTNLAHAFYFRREYERAAEQCRRALNLNANFANAHADLSRALVLLGQKREAVREAETAMRLGGGAMNGLSRLGYAYARAGMEREARQTLEQLEAARTQGWNAGLGIAVVHAGLGDRTKALEWLERLTAERAPYLRTVWNDPALEEVLKQEARFSALLRSMRLPPGQNGDRPQSN